MSDRYPGGFLKVVPPELDPALGNAAPGMWTLEQYLKYQKAGTWPAYDPYFNQTVLSLHGNGANGAQNNTFLDSSSNNFTITRNGNTTQGTFSPFSAPDGWWSNYFDGTGDAFRASASSLSMSSFTIEGWVNYSSDTGVRTFIDFANALNGYSVLAGYSSTSGNFFIQFFSGNSSLNLIGTINISSWSTYFNQWTHLAITYDGSTYRVFVNGVLGGSLSSATAPISVNYITIGGRAEATPSQNLAGYISNLRYVTGAALYTSDFTPSTTPLTTAGSGTTQFIFAQSNRFVDTEGNYTFTIFGNPKVTPLSPFAPTAAYSASVNGGSGYFDGTGDYLTAASNSAFYLSSGDFTLEAWVYKQTTGRQIIVSQTQNNAAPYAGWLFYINTSNQLRFEGNNGAGINSSTTFPLNQWVHVAAVRSSGTINIYENGVSVVSGTPSISDFNGALTIGQYTSPVSGSEWNGYISNLRLIKGQALTTGNFTPPTAPVTTSAVGWTGANAAASITGTVSLLCNFTNAGIFDNTGKNNLETVADAQIDTTTKKFGTGSMEFDGTDDRLPMASNPDFAFGTGDFTVEFWMNSNDVSAAQRGMIQTSATAGGLQASYTSGIVILQGAGASPSSLVGGLAANIAGTFLLSNTAVLSTGTWYHIALVRSGSTASLYVNGTLHASATATGNCTGQNCVVGGYYSTSFLFNGFIDDLRITKGVARYTSNFTPQTSQWQDQ